MVSTLQNTRAWEPAGGTWGNNSATMSLNLNVSDPNDGAGSIDSWNTQAEDALARWNGVPNSIFAFLFNNNNEDECDRFDLFLPRSNAVEWNNFIESQTKCGDIVAANTLGVTVFLDISGFRNNADVLFNKNTICTTGRRFLCWRASNWPNAINASFNFILG